MVSEALLLSICIPTFNRAEILRKSLDAILDQKEFKETDEVEIVISDNCSTDETRSVVAAYIALHPGKIRYHCNSENNADLNFEQALSLGRGKFLKLLNDSALASPGTLADLLNVIRATQEERPVIFCSNRISSGQEPISVANNLSEFLMGGRFYVSDY